MLSNFFFWYETRKIKTEGHLQKFQDLLVDQELPVPVAHACNPSYSGGRDQDDHGKKPTPGK
jgi:hypothetical protein